MFDKLLEIFESFLGDTKRGLSEGGQCQFDCPDCNDGKYNLEANFKKGVYRCWSCQDNSGKLSTLIKKYGNDAIFNEYKKEMDDIRNSRLYKLNGENIDDMDIGENLFQLPKCCEKINPNNPKHKKAIDYLIQERGITLDIIKRYNISCTGNKCENWIMNNRVIIPSYDKFDSLNYYTGRLYQYSKYQSKYLNPDKEKQDIIFNENLINWDGDIRLLEGPFDHIVVPNSIPILGKELNHKFYLYKELLEKAHSITLLGDGEAFKDWLKIYKNLNVGRLKGKIRIVKYNNDDDPSSIFKRESSKGIAKLLNTSYTINEEELLLL